MKKTKQILMGFVLVLISLLFFMSIYGAFLGSERAQRFFNSFPLVVYWFLLGVLFLSAFFVYGTLLRKPWLVLIHLGCVFILIGGFAGSKMGHAIQKKITGVGKIYIGQMPIFVGQSENEVFIDKNTVRTLPFSIQLTDFRTVYYQPGTVYVYTEDDKYQKLTARNGAKIFLGEDIGNVEVVNVYENCKIKVYNDRIEAYESQEAGTNPAVELCETMTDGTTKTRYVFERLAGHDRPEDKIRYVYRRAVKDWISDVQIIKDGRVVAEKSIEVNHPLNFGGYDFYQHSYDPQDGRYSVLLVSSDTGVKIVFAGYFLLLAGLVGHFWLRSLAWKVSGRVGLKEKVEFTQTGGGPAGGN